jgi:hypothetical protein
MGIKKIILVGPTPHWEVDLPKIILRKLWRDTPRRTYVGIQREELLQNARLQRDFRQTDSIVFANVIDLFCDKSGCLTYLGGDRKTGITSYDYGHLTPIASDYLARHRLVGLVIGSDLETR